MVVYHVLSSRIDNVVSVFPREGAYLTGEGFCAWLDFLCFAWVNTDGYDPCAVVRDQFLMTTIAVFKRYDCLSPVLAQVGAVWEVFTTQFPYVLRGSIGKRRSQVSCYTVLIMIAWLARRCISFKKAQPPKHRAGRFVFRGVCHGYTTLQTAECIF